MAVIPGWVYAAGLVLSGVGLASGHKASKEAMKLAQDQYKLSLQQFAAQREKAFEEVKQASDVANLTEAKGNVQEAYKAALNSLENAGVLRSQGLADEYGRTRKTDVSSLFDAGRIPDIETLRQARENKMADAAIGSGLAGEFSNAGAPGSTAGGWGAMYNAAATGSASALENRMRTIAGLQSHVSGLQDIESADQRGMSKLARSDTEQARMAKALEVDTGIADSTIGGQLTRKGGEITSAEASIDRGYNTGKTIFPGVDTSAYAKAASTASLIGGVASAFDALRPRPSVPTGFSGIEHIPAFASGGGMHPGVSTAYGTMPGGISSAGTTTHPLWKPGSGFGSGTM